MNKRSSKVEEIVRESKCKQQLMAADQEHMIIRNCEDGCGGLYLNRSDGRREIIYQMTMMFTRKLLKEELISRVEYDQFNAIMKHKYSPIYGDLFTSSN